MLRYNVTISGNGSKKTNEKKKYIYKTKIMENI